MVRFGGSLERKSHGLPKKSKVVTYSRVAMGFESLLAIAATDQMPVVLGDPIDDLVSSAIQLKDAEDRSRASQERIVLEIEMHIAALTDVTERRMFAAWVFPLEICHRRERTILGCAHVRILQKG